MITSTDSAELSSPDGSSLFAEWTLAKASIYRDGYDMSFGELFSLYERGELILNPEYQRLFRWDESQKTRFIESVLLNIPIPPLFVFGDEHGKWELVDGLQRLSTLLEFCGLLKDELGEPTSVSKCTGTNLLPSLDNFGWEDLPAVLQLAIKRARIRIEILGQQSDLKAKYELFQRLNTGGSNLSEQEVRSCVVYATNSHLFGIIKQCTEYEPFKLACSLSEVQLERQYDRELVSRFMVYRHVTYDKRLDIAEYIDAGMLQLATSEFDYEAEIAIFEDVFDFVAATSGSSAFGRRGASRAFSVSAFEFITLGLSRRLESGKPLSERVFKTKLAGLNAFKPYTQNAASGVRGTDRLRRLIFEHSVNYFK